MCTRLFCQRSSYIYNIKLSKCSEANNFSLDLSELLFRSSCCSAQFAKTWILNALQLKDTTMDPQKRTLLKVTLEDADKADKIFTALMGEEVEPRREFIEKNAVYVQNLDV